MITRRTKLQLLALVVITLIGTTYVGAKYARLDRVFSSSSYDVTVHLAESGGIFSGADATYRGVSVGRVTDMWLTTDGVDVTVSVDPDSAKIPSDTEVVIANKSAVGEQYLDFQPHSDAGPYLADGSQIALKDTKVPLDTKSLLTDVDGLVASVNTDDLQTVVEELGLAFEGSAEDLRQVIDNSDSFVTTANEKYEVTAALLKESTGVLQTQMDSESSLKSYAKDLAVLTQSLRSSDADLRTVLDSGPATAATLRDVIAENGPQLGQLIQDVITTNRVVKARLPGIKGVFTIAPYGLESAFSVIAKDPRTGLYGARFSLVLQPDNAACLKGYDKDQRSPYDVSNRAPDSSAGCAESGANPRGSKGAAGASSTARSSAASSGPVVGTYDVSRSTVTPSSGQGQDTVADGSSLGKESWKWLMLGPAVTK